MKGVPFRAKVRKGKERPKPKIAPKQVVVADNSDEEEQGWYGRPGQAPQRPKGSPPQRPQGSILKAILKSKSGQNKRKSYHDEAPRTSKAAKTARKIQHSIDRKHKYTAADISSSEEDDERYKRREIRGAQDDDLDDTIDPEFSDEEEQAGEEKENVGTNKDAALELQKRRNRLRCSTL